MKAIRGATTVERDSPEFIKKAVGELLAEIGRKNNLLSDDIVCAIFSSTSDIRSYYPAKAAREAGFYRCPLFSALEPPIKGSLARCIRVLILAECGSAVHVYMNEAVALRGDIAARFNIAIDGPAGSGKSTVADILAKRFGVLHLDTGAMYRACALKCIRDGVSVNDESAVAATVENIDLKIEYAGGAQKTVLDGKDVSAGIRRSDVSMAASLVSTYGAVREKMVALQRQFAAENSCILDGRDIGTNVLPDARFKFFLTASPEVRAQRRWKEDYAKGSKEPYRQILEDIKRRDMQDSTRAIAPLKAAADAIVLDTSNMNIDEVVSVMERRIQEKI